MKIQLLHFSEGCPKWQPTLERMREVLREERLPDHVEVIEIRTQADAERYRFLGSPTVRVNGKDIDPSVWSRTDYGFGCRIYDDNGKPGGVPPKDLIRRALQGDFQPAASETTGGTDRSKVVLGASVVSAIAASLCCILPLLAALLGVSGVAAASVFAKWRPVFLLVTVVLLGLGWYLTYRKPKEACAEGAACATKPVAKWNKIVLWVATALVVVMATLPIYSGAIARWTQSGPASASPITANAATLSVKIPSMDCDACAAGIQAVLQKQPGVQKAQVTFATKEAVVQYDPQKTSKDKLIAAINQTGFKVAP